MPCGDSGDGKMFSPVLTSAREMWMWQPVPTSSAHGLGTKVAMSSCLRAAGKEQGDRIDQPREPRYRTRTLVKPTSVDDFARQHEIVSRLVDFTGIRGDLKLSRSNLRVGIIDADSHGLASQDHFVKGLSGFAKQRLRRAVERVVESNRVALFVELVVEVEFGFGAADHLEPELVTELVGQLAENDTRIKVPCSWWVSCEVNEENGLTVKDSLS